MVNLHEQKLLIYERAKYRWNVISFLLYVTFTKIENQCTIVPSQLLPVSVWERAVV